MPGEAGDSCNKAPNGDKICDTPADPNMEFNVDPNTCLWNDIEYDVNTDLFNPDEKNIMGYSHVDCQEYFSDGQGKWMRNKIASEQLLQDCLIPFTFTDHQIITTTTWAASEYLISGTLTVESGATFTVSAGTTIRFAEGSKLILKPNAILNLDGILTSFCGRTWKGVEVWGNTAASQFPIGGVLAQGKFVGRPGSIVENAEIGVQLWGPDLTGSGGQISCIGTTFKNNIISVTTAKYENTWPFPFPPGWQGQPRNYVGSFTACDFNTDNDYPHTTPFKVFANLLSVNGFRFSGCHFENGSGNTECSSFSDFGYGIFANSSGFTVSGQCLDIFFPCTNYNRTTFKGLGVGIHTQSTTKNRPYVVKQADFEDCFFGIYQNLVDGATIVNNNFYMGDLPSSNCTGNQIGVALQDFANGLTVQENLFFSNGGNASNTIGTSATLTWEFNNVIRRNTYNGVTYGNIAGGRNAVLTEIPIGLNYECNTNINVSQYDFLVSELPGFSPNNIRNKQGLLTGLNTFSASGNKFSYTGSPSDSDFGNQGGWIIDLEYFYAPLGVNETPIDFSDITPEDVTANPCLIAYCDPPCKYPNEVSLEKQRFYNYKNVFNTAKSNYLAAVNSGNTTLASIKANEAGYARQEMDRSGHMVLLHIMYDTLTYHRDTLRRWLGNFETYSTDLALARDYVDAGQFVEAETVLNNIPTKYVLDANDLMDLQATISIFALINQKTLYGMSESDFPFLTSLVPHPVNIP